MRVAILYFDKSSKGEAVAKALATGVEEQGHQTETIDGFKESEKRLTIYDYIVVGTTARSLLSGKIPESVGNFMKNCGSIVGKRSYAYVVKRGLFSGRALRRVMAICEREGTLLKLSDIIHSKADARAIGKSLKIEKTTR